MPSNSELNLLGIAWPMSLLKFNCALNDMCSCDVLEVIARDPDVVENIVMIVERSGDTLINQLKDGGIYHLSIEKRA